MLKKGVSITITFPMVDDTTADFATGLTVAAQVKKDAGSFTAATGAVTENGTTGTYDLTLTASEMDAEKVAVLLTATGALDQLLVYFPIAEVQADMVKISGDSAAADNLEGMFDGSGYINGNAPATQDQATAIHNKTTNLPGDPASESNATTNKNTIVTEVDQNETKIDAMQGDATAIKSKTDNLPNDPAKESKQDAIQNTVDGISNVTRLSVGIPKYMTRPPAGDKAILVNVALKDTDGNLEDPDGNQLAINVYNSGGTSRNGNLYKDYALTTPLDDGTGDFVGWKQLVRDAVGLYKFYYKVTHDATEEELQIDFGWNEDSKLQIEYRKTQVTDITGDIGQVQSDVTAIKERTDNLPDDPTSETNATTNKDAIISEVDDNETKIDSMQGDVTDIKTQTDKMHFDGDNIQARVADKGVLNDASPAAIADAVLEEPVDDHKGVTGSLAQLTFRKYAKQFGKEKHDAADDKGKIYAPGGALLAEYDLKNKNGDPIDVDVYSTNTFSERGEASFV